MRGLLGATAWQPRALLMTAAPEPLFISSATNARIKLVKKMQARRQRDRTGLMLLEGHRLVIDALEGGFAPEFVLCTKDAVESAAEGQRLRAALGDIPPSAFAFAPPELVAELSDTQTPQGVLAVFPQPALALPASPDLVLVCDRVADPGNLGTLLRSAVGAGVSAAVLTPGCSDAWGLKALRAGMGAQLRLPVRSADSWAQASDWLGRWGCSVRAADAAGTAAHYELDWSVPSALVVGSEAHGLSAEVREDAAVALCSIPQAGGIESLNAGVAGSVILYEAQRQRSARAEGRG